jgi:hypothetical protein
MASNSNAVAKATIAAVERARLEVESLKGQLHRIQLERGEQAAHVARELGLRLAQAEAIVAKAELSVKRIKVVGRVPPRPTATIPQAHRAKRALSVLSGLSPVQPPPAVKRRLDGHPHQVDTEAGSHSNGHQVAIHRGELKNEDLTEEALSSLIAEVAAETGMTIDRMSPLSLSLLSPRVFAGSIWLDRSEPDAASLRVVSVCICSAEEGFPARWSCSRFAVFQLLTERARAAARYYHASRLSTADAFRELLRWLASHSTLFSDVADNRRLGFDSSRGVYLPPCVRAFGSPSPPRFTRGSIPARHTAPPQSQYQPSRHAPSQPSSTA